MGPDVGVVVYKRQGALATPTVSTGLPYSANTSNYVEIIMCYLIYFYCICVKCVQKLCPVFRLHKDLKTFNTVGLHPCKEIHVGLTGWNLQISTKSFFFFFNDSV